MIRPCRDPLRQLLRRRVEGLSDLALAKEEVSGRELEDLEKLSRLLELRAALRSRGRRWAWLFAILVILSVLLFVPVSCTEVTVDVEVGQVDLTLDKNYKLTEAVRLRSIGVAGLRELQVPRARERSAETLRAVERGILAVRLSAGGNEQDNLTLASLTPSAATRCRMAKGEAPGRLWLSLQGDKLELELVAQGDIQFVIPGQGEFELDIPSPRSIRLVPAGQNLDLDLELSEGPGRLLASQVAVRDLSFLRVEEEFTSERSLVRLLSTIRSGTLYLESLDGREHLLRAGEMLRFESSSGWLRSLKLESDHLALDFRGWVHGMKLGAGSSRQSLMPSLLDWLQAQQAIALFWGAVLLVAGVLEFVVRWRRIS